MLEAKAHKGDGDPAAETEKNRFPAAFDEFDDVCVEPDRSHRHYDEEL